MLLRRSILVSIFPSGSCRSKIPKEGDNGSLFPGIENYPQELLFSAIESEELGGDFGGDGDNSGEDLLEEGELRAMTVSPTQKPFVDLIALQSKMLPLYPFLLRFHLIFNWFLLNTEILLVETPSPLSLLPPLSQVAKEPKLPLAHPVSLNDVFMTASFLCQ